MIGDTYHSSETTTYLPAFCIPPINGLTLPANVVPDTSITTGYVIYLHLTTFTGPNPEQLQETTTLPLVSSNQAFGGQVVMYSPKIFPRFQLEGFIDTPCIRSGENYLPIPQDSVTGVRYLYPEILAMMIEGRANWSGPGLWNRLDPLWFRDPYGRLYTSIRITDYTAQYVPGTPERMQFTMTLKI